MNEKQIHLAIAKSLGKESLPGHKFEGRDDNRWFECSSCGQTYSWGDYKKSGEPLGPCANWSYEEDRYEQMRDILLSKLTCAQGAEYIKHLWKLVAHYKTDWFGADAAYLLVLADINQMREAYLKTMGLWIEEEQFLTE